MANILSQNEIDELLNVLSSGKDITVETEPEDNEREVRVYDFRTADKFSKEQDAALHI